MTKSDLIALQETIGENCITEYNRGWNDGFEAGKNAAMRWLQRTTAAMMKEELKYGTNKDDAAGNAEDVDG